MTLFCVTLCLSFLVERRTCDRQTYGQTDIRRQHIQCQHSVVQWKLWNGKLNCNWIKLAPYGTGGRLLLTANVKVTWHKNWDKDQKSGPVKLYVLSPNLRIPARLPATIINGGDSLWKWSNFRLSRARDLDLDLGSGHTAYRHASVVDLYRHTEFHEKWRNFLWTDGWADGHLRPALLGRLVGVDLKNKVKLK